MHPQKAPAFKALSSSIGSKFLIAFTGISLLIFLVAHLAGNLLFIAGPDAFNEYSHALVSNPLVYVAELGLLAVFALHIIKTVGLVAGSYAARPQRYAKRTWAKTKNDRSRKSVSSSTMIVTGTVMLLFVVTHLATFKFGPYYETPEGIRDIYRLQLAVFSSPAYVAFYIVAMGIIVFHLWHGVTSALQSFGVNSPTWTPRLQLMGRGLAVLLGIGFAALPIFTFILGARS
ncbi:MAG TPA: succinate dehydrogenase cytochrome b subunit [Vicinamibacterales bacterium]|nr:succinate dehydrogenase cytochrome b subunit [Vicinamibacterales bacterium]